MRKQGLVLFAHGARDPRWAEPFELLRRRVNELRRDVTTRLAYLESMTPDLPSAVAELAAAGCTEVRICPIFFGQGGHVRQDLPGLVARVEAAYPAIRFTSLTAAGEDGAVRDAVAAFCIDGL